MYELCQRDCCENCEFHEIVCAGCAETGGHPCGGTCVVAEGIQAKGLGALYAQESEITKEINALNIEGLELCEMNLLLGGYVNLEYTLPGGKKARLLDDKRVYWANQLERPGTDRCYGVVADDSLLLVCEYGCGGEDAELLVYKKRG